MDGIVGMTVSRGLDAAARSRVRAAEDRALAEVPWLATAELDVGDTHVRVWGHGNVAGAVHRLPDGGVAVVAGRPRPEPTTDELAAFDGRVPWEGRLLVVRIAPDGTRWEAFNDWAAALPTFHATGGAGAILSTWEPVVVAGAGLRPDDISRPGLLSLLVHGFYIGDRTLYEPMRALLPDVAARWDADGFQARPQESLRPSDERWHTGWDELADGFHERMVAAVRRGLDGADAWRIPLSGGMDSRMIAAVAAEDGIGVETFTYGDKGWLDVRFARSAARMLGVPWHHVPLGTEYLPRRCPTWGALFGSSLHFHGMYQFPLLEAMGHEGPPIAMGYTGDPMGGAQTAGMMAGDRPGRRRFVDKWHMWEDDEAAELVRFDAGDALAELDADIEGQLASFGDAPLYQRMWLVFQRNHMARFPTYQPTMYDAWSGVGTPYVDRELASYALSLPRAALDDRRLQLDAFRRGMPALATIPGTYSPHPAAPSGRWYARRTLADILPRRFHRGPLGEFAPPPNTHDQDAFAASGEAGAWPIHAVWDELGEWVDTTLVTRAEQEARAGDLRAMAKVQAVQALAWALLP